MQIHHFFHFVVVSFDFYFNSTQLVGPPSLVLNLEKKCFLHSLDPHNFSFFPSLKSKLMLQSRSLAIFFVTNLTSLLLTPLRLLVFVFHKQTKWKKSLGNRTFSLLLLLLPPMKPNYTQILLAAQFWQKKWKIVSSR